MSNSIKGEDQLLRSAVAGNRTAMNFLLDRHRTRLKRLVAVRLNTKLRARVDPSDVVQEVLVEAAKRLDEYTSSPGAPFYPWLRQIACQRLIDVTRRHVTAERRSVHREQRFCAPLPDHSAVHLAERLVASVSSPSKQANRKELQNQVQSALASLKEDDREILIMRYLEQIPPGEIAEVLRISDRTVRERHRRALNRMVALLADSELD